VVGSTLGRATAPITGRALASVGRAEPFVNAGRISRLPHWTCEACGSSVPGEVFPAEHECRRKACGSRTTIGPKRRATEVTCALGAGHPPPCIGECGGRTVHWDKAKS
jgi:hypothetical protein